MKYNVYRVERVWVDDDPETLEPIMQDYDEFLYSVETDDVAKIMSTYGNDGVKTSYGGKIWLGDGPEAPWIEIRKEVH